ncbi:membrane protein YczE [Parafrigoribacterium soli]|uniref:membrane protein YczE n=1 Tax=Parafrigoribacterium soli TaxID=3144663 RepID=UPI0032EDB39C
MVSVVHPSRRLPLRYTQLLIGLFLYGIAIAMMVQAAVGIAPWDVLSQGISIHTGIPFGWVTNLVGIVVLLLWIPIRQKPGIGTVLNVLLIGPSAQLGLGIIPTPTILWEQILLFTGGLVLLAIATGLYLGARFGPGPRDGLMTGIHNKWGWRIWVVRASIELCVLAIGWLLGGNVGFGTLAFALLVGPLVHIAMPLLVIKDRSGAPVEPLEPAQDASGERSELAKGDTPPAAEQLLPPRGI